MKICWDDSYLRYKPLWQKLRKLRNYQKWLAWSGYVTKSLVLESICCEKSLFFKRVQKHIGNELNMTKLRWTESSCVLCKLVQHIPIICHTKLFSQCYNKNFVILVLFWCFFKLCQLPSDLFRIFFQKIQNWVVLNEI